MSKSLGNSPDPIVIIDKYGADALRFGIVMITPKGQDILFSEHFIEVAKNFANKIWNAARYILMNSKNYTLQDIDFKNDVFTPADKWILIRLNQIIERIDNLFEKYELNIIAKELYNFVWHEFCDWYIEFTKPIIYEKIKKGSKQTTIKILLYSLQTILKLLHPFMPFITEELFQNIPGINEESITISKWPKPLHLPFSYDDPTIDIIMEIIKSIRTIRGEMQVKPSEKVDVYIKSQDNLFKNIVENERIYIITLANLNNIYFIEKPDFSKFLAHSVVKSADIYVDLTGKVDLLGEKNRLEKEIKKAEKELSKVDRNLSNPNFLKRAPDEVVKKNQLRKEELMEKIEKLKDSLNRINSIIERKH